MHDRLLDYVLIDYWRGMASSASATSTRMCATCVEVSQNIPHGLFYFPPSGEGLSGIARCYFATESV